MAPKDKMRFHFCNQKKEIMNLKNEKKKKKFHVPCHFLELLQDLFECGRVEINKRSFLLRVCDQ